MSPDITKGLPVKDILGWDVVNWSTCLRTWAPHVSTGHLDCLEIGCGPGGISLWLANNGHRVLCSDVALPRAEVHDLHKRYGVSDRIEYAAIDCTAISYRERFDLIVLKSVLGGVWAHCGEDGFHKAIDGMRNALKPNGKILFAENVRATALHEFSRRHLLKRTASDWIYPTVEKMVDSFTPFATMQYQLTGLLGCFGRAEWQRMILASVDRLVVPLVPRGWRYVMAGVATK